MPELKRLKAAETKTLYVFGSADLTHSLLEAGLVDELMFCVGAGVCSARARRFFKPGQKIGLELTRRAAPLPPVRCINTYSVKQAA